jgi:hypothetical protein
VNVEQFLVLCWNGLKWTASNSHTALVPCGPYSSEHSAQTNIDKYVAENAEDFPECAREVKIVSVMWPMEAPVGFEGVPQFGD